MSHIINKQISDQALGAAFTVHNILGPGLVESAYENALCAEFQYRGIPYKKQVVYPVYYRGQIIGGYIADLVVDNALILEIKSVAQLSPVMEAQLLNYLRLSKIPVGYLLNFRNTRLVWKRFVVTRRE